MKNIISYTLGISTLVLMAFSTIGLNNQKTGNEFEIQIDNKANNRVILACNLGCAWEKLRFNCESNTCNTTIDQFGIHSESNDTKAPELADFIIDVSREEKTYSFICSKGCAWTELSTTVTVDEQTDYFLTQSGLEFVVEE